MVNVFCYVIDPIDHWELAKSFEEFIDELEQSVSDEDEEYRIRAELFLVGAKKLARKNGWEGDITEGPYVFGIPPNDSEPNFLMGVAWKQGNNGTTFVCSPIPLPHLGQESTGAI